LRYRLKNYDLLIRNGHIIDGTGSPWYVADIAILDGHIATVGQLESAGALRINICRLNLET
jgi:dihydroorotase/N-acyl-D-amino-acid deacylase